MTFSNIATHVQPVWRNEADWILHADLQKDGMDERGEQLWTRRIATDRFRICCIPFFTYGIALGDVVQADTENIVTGVTERSGHRNLRVAITLEEQVVHNELQDWAETTGLLYEWFEGKYLAIDLPTIGETSLNLARLKSLA